MNLRVSSLARLEVLMLQAQRICKLEGFGLIGEWVSKVKEQILIEQDKHE